MHDGWYDSSTLFGHDYNVNDPYTDNQTMRRWDINANVVTKQLAPAGCHGAMSSDRKLVASETNYESNPDFI